MSYLKNTPMGNTGNSRLLKEYGGGTRHERKMFAKGGAVKSERMHKADGGPTDAGGREEIGTTDGQSARPRNDRPGRKMPGKHGKAGTNITIAMMPHPAAAMPVPVPAVGAAPMPPAPHPMMPPTPMPAGPGMPPMGMPHKNGGKVKARFAKGGRVKRADGGEADDSKGKDEPKARIVPESEIQALRKKYDLDAHPEYDSIDENGKAFDSRAKKPEPQSSDLKKGGRVSRANGGKIPHLDAGAGGAEGRLEKAKDYGDLPIKTHPSKKGD